MALKRLLFDIETSPCLGWFWRPSHQTSIGYHQILEHAKVICICYKWSDSSKVYHLNWDSKQDDKAMISKFIKIMGHADEIIGHNVDKFDTKWIRARAIFHGLEMPYDYKSIDTLKESRKHFNFPSNRLDAICKYLGIGEKIKTTEELWMDIWRKKSSKAMKQMIKYCKRDVLILEEYFNILNKYIKPKIRISQNRAECPECGSDHLIKRGYYNNIGGTRVVKLQCQSCRKYTTTPLRVYLKLTK